MTHLESQPLKKPFFTPGTFVLMVLTAVGFAFGIARLLTGLGTVTNLSDAYPWGIWIAIDVACGVALAAGGFTTAALVDIFGRKKYHALLRPAILTAWLGYIMVGVGLTFDLGRYWNIWQPTFNWQGNSVMFELAMCVMAYLTVLTFEMAPSILEGFKARIEENLWGGRILKRVEKPIRVIHQLVKTTLPIFIVAGVVLSCMHQSSLGTLMVLAPTKLSSLWYTAWLPLLFLLSAIMVGFPMVILESLFSSKGLKREAEMELLAPLAAKIPIFIAIYGVFRFGDLIARFNQLNFSQEPMATVSFFLEVVLGLFFPFVLLLFRQVRRSRGWLFSSCFLVIFGVVINRLNVFLVGYRPSFAAEHYFPSIGEIALTVGLMSLLILLYRFFVNYFPILPVLVVDDEAEETERKQVSGAVAPRTAMIFRGAAVVFLFGFILLYVSVHKTAIAEAVSAESKFIYGDVSSRDSHQSTVKPKASHTHAHRPEKYRNFYLIDSPLLNSRNDYYEPVRFSHRTHDDLVGGDCSVCHHRVSDDDSDRVGTDITAMHREIDVRIGGACIRCHEDLEEKKFQKCSVCHIASNEADFPARIGLRGAYHRQCIGCHQESPESAFAPTDCKSCHHPLTPDHATLTASMDVTAPRKITEGCLSCHEAVGQDVLHSAHWNWKGLTPAITGHEHDVDTGLLQVMDNYTVTMNPALTASSAFHIGYSAGEQSLSKVMADVNNIDCLICHDTTGTYAKDDGLGGLPTPGVDLAAVVKSVGRPARNNCGSCHFNMSGGPNLKHGDLEPALNNPTAEMDVHMGMVGMRCQDCHRTESHQIAGMSFMAPVTEGRVNCITCHGNHPHGITGMLSRHLDDHLKAVACETCHIPQFATESPTRLTTDFSTAGKDKDVVTDQYGMPLYDKKIGDMTWGKQVTPVYRWFDGNRKTYVLGDKLESTDSENGVELNAPLGEKHLPKARIYPFKVHTAIQPYDKEKEILAAVKFKNGFWEHFDWEKAVGEGMKTVGLEYSGKHGFVKTRMYTSLHHQVVPMQKSLGCADCHRVEAVTCTRCHTKAKGMEQPSHTRMVYPEVKNRMDFKALGYEDDPAMIGGRFYYDLGRGNPPK